LKRYLAREIYFLLSPGQITIARRPYRRRTPAARPTPRTSARPLDTQENIRGSTYNATTFTALCTRLGIRQSMGRAGSCFDNAAAEALFSSLNGKYCPTIYSVILFTRGLW
jgi:transposase InsO family protein